MKNEIVKAGAQYVVSTDDESIKKTAGSALITVGAGGMLLYGAAALLPFVNLFMLMVAAVVLGIYTYTK